MDKLKPSVVFTLSHMDGKERFSNELRKNKLNSIEIHFKATGYTALQLLSKSLTVAQHLAAADMHVSYNHGVLNFKLLTCLSSDNVYHFAEQISKAFDTEVEVKSSSKSIKGWFDQKTDINETYKISPHLNRFVAKLTAGIFIMKDFNLV